ncbi:MAG: hypothetical protein IH991_11995 [Planctomycetes bacterium]|nr:hypothetical protein [Planctomycetota bacterium]
MIVQCDSDWEGWLRFFLTGVYETSRQAVDTARTLMDLFDHDRRQIETLGRAAGSAFRLHRLFQQSPMLSIRVAAKSLGLSHPTVSKSMAHMRRLGIVSELTGRQRNRLFVYDAYLLTMSEGVEPIEP